MEIHLTLPHMITLFQFLPHNERHSIVSIENRKLDSSLAIFMLLEGNIQSQSDSCR
jgi:hypothetical protein